MNWQDALVKELSPKETRRGFESHVGHTGLKIVQLFNDTPDMLLVMEANWNASGNSTLIFSHVRCDLRQYLKKARGCHGVPKRRNRDLRKHIGKQNTTPTLAIKSHSFDLLRIGEI